jgi:two-component system response regulator
VVEDDPAYLSLVRRAFSARGKDTDWELTVVKDGEEALRLLFGEDDDNFPLPDLILLDWNLPKVTGYDVLRRVKSHRRFRRIPILVFSTSDAEDDIHDAYDCHANGYITKPGDVDELAAIVEMIERFWGAVQHPKVVRRSR